jgi:hypothetical protein
VVVVQGDPQFHPVPGAWPVLEDRFEHPPHLPAIASGEVEVVGAGTHLVAVVVVRSVAPRSRPVGRNATPIAATPATLSSRLSQLLNPLYRMRNNPRATSVATK